MPQLLQQLHAFLQSSPDWSSDMAPAWRSYISNVQPDYSAVNTNLSCSQNSIFPGRKAAPPSSAPPGSHIFRAFDGLHPDDVKVVIIGDAPYHDAKVATGRAFECGNLEYWPSPQQSPKLQPSMYRIMQHWAAHWATFRNPQQRGQYLATGKTARKKLYDDLSSGYFTSATYPNSRTPLSLFQHWESQGVLMFNASLTHTKKSHKGAHRKLWAPVTQAICYRLASLQQNPIVFLSLGMVAAFMLSQSKAINNRRANKRYILHFHPSSRFIEEFLRGPNIFRLINQNLSALGVGQIRW